MTLTHLLLLAALTLEFAIAYALAWSSLSLRNRITCLSCDADALASELEKAGKTPMKQTPTSQSEVGDANAEPPTR